MTVPHQFQRPPLRLARRPLLGAALLGLVAPARAAARSRSLARAGLAFDEFLAEAVPQAQDLIGDTSRAGQDRYLLALASLAACLRDVPVPEMNDTTNARSPARTFMGVNVCDAPFTVLHWRMEPGALIGLHPHISGNVVTVVLDGEVRIENYEMVGERDFDLREPFAVRRSTDQVLLPGDVNLVSLEHNYMHGFFAGPEGARGLDITTRIREKRPTPTLELAPEPLDPTRQLWEARWGR
jgi:hypothetical protein